MSLCNPCDQVSGSFGLVPRDQAYTNVQSVNFLTQKAKFCDLNACNINIESVNLASTLVTFEVGQNQVIPDSTEPELVFFPSVAREGLEGYDGTTGFFTAPTDALYSFTMQLNVQPSATTVKYLVIRREGSGLPDWIWQNREIVNVIRDMKVTVPLSAGDQVSFRFRSTGAPTTLLASFGNVDERVYSQLEIVQHV